MGTATPRTEESVWRDAVFEEFFRLTVSTALVQGRTSLGWPDDQRVESVSPRIAVHGVKECRPEPAVSLFWDHVEVGHVPEHLRP